MKEEAFEQLLALGHEQHGVEFKRGGPASDGHLFAVITRAALGMANRRDGGAIVVGVDDQEHTLTPVGLSLQDLATWTYDHVADKFAAYADPPFNFDVEHMQYDGKNFVVITVQEFDETPIVCKKNYERTLRNGACYVRPRRKPETTEVPSHADMRDLIDLAVEKRLRRVLHTVLAAGVGVPTASDDDKFAAQYTEMVQNARTI